MKIRKFTMPDPLALLVGGIFLAAALTWVLPAGKYERREDPATHRSVVVNGTYKGVEAQPVGPWAAMVAVPTGLAAGSGVIFFVFLAGGALTVVDRTGALRGAVDGLAHVLGERETMIVPVFCLLFGTMGAVEQMQEEIIALIPLLLLVTRRVGFDALTAAAMSVGAAMIGAAFSPWNPFQTIIAQRIAGLPVGSASGFRAVMLVIALALWTAATMRYAIRTRGAPQPAGEAAPPGSSAARSYAVMLIVAAALTIFVLGITTWGWDFETSGAAIFLALGIVAGLAGGLGVNGTAGGLADGFRSMGYAALLFGFARVIRVVLEQGHVMDTIVYGLFMPLQHLPLAASAAGMVAVQGAIHVAVPSTSGQAALTMPVLVPLSDLLGLSRQVTVLAFQAGAGMCELLTPTNGAMMAVIAAAGVSYDKWLRFAAPIVAIMVLGALLAIFVAIAIGLG